MSAAEILTAAKTVGSLPADDWAYQPSMFADGQKCALDARREAQYDKLECFAHKPPAALIAKAGQIKVARVADLAGAFGSWAKFDDGDPESRVNRLMKQIGERRGAAVLVAKQWPDHDGWADNGELAVTDRLRGLDDKALSPLPNHFVALTGFDRTKRQFYFKNSWGVGWGRGGYGWISFDDINTPFVGRSFLYASYI